MTITERLHRTFDQLELRDRPVEVHAALRTLTPRVDADLITRTLTDRGCTVLAFTAGPGAYASSIRSHPAATHGNHPTDTISAIGPYAAYYTNTQTPTQPHQPYLTATYHNAAVLLIGVNFRALTLLHAAENLAGLPQRTIHDEHNQPIVTGGCSVQFHELAALLPPPQSTVINNSTWKTWAARDVLTAAITAFRDNPAIGHCQPGTCDRCDHIHYHAQKPVTR